MISLMRPDSKGGDSIAINIDGEQQKAEIKSCDELAFQLVTSSL